MMQDWLQGRDSAPRFAVESDSSDSAFEDPEAGDVSSPRRSKKPRIPVPRIEVEGTDFAEDLFVLFGESGRAVSAGLDGLQTVGKALVDGSQVASICSARTHTLLLVKAGIQLDHQTPLAKRLLQIIKPKRLRVIDIYSVQSYLADADMDEATAPIRFLQTAGGIVSPNSHLQLYDVPNLVTGLSAALLTEAAHLHLPALLLLLPSLAGMPTLHSQLHQSRHRPPGVYDPAEAGEDDEQFSFSRLVGRLSEKERHETGLDLLAWSASMTAQTNGAHSAWQWADEQERVKMKQSRQYEDLYL